MSDEVAQLITNINSQIIAPIILLLFVFSLVLFFWGVFDFIRGADSEETRKIGRSHMLWGIGGMFIMVSAWGIILIVLKTFGVDTSKIEFPSVIFQDADPPSEVI